MPITTSHFSKALWPGINKWYGDAYDEFNVEFLDIFDKFSSSRPYEEDVGTSGLGLMNVKTQGNSVAYDEMQQGFTSRYQHLTYALGFIITEEAYEDDQYDVVGERGSRGLAFSARQTMETVGANVLNRGFSSTYKGGDGVELFSSVHPNVAGGTFRNELATPADLSEASLEQACIDLADMQNDRGLKIAVMPKRLIVPSELMFDADRILKTEYTVGSADNDLNVVRNKFPGGVSVNHYLTNPDAWFIKTNVQNGMKYFERKAPVFTNDSDFDTDNAKFKASFRGSWGWTDPRGIFGSEGAA